MRHILHNFGALAVIAQVCIVYFLAALGKLSDPVWLGGNAALTIAGVDHFSAGNGLQWPALIYVVLNYFVIAYQLLFPVLAFFKGIRMPFLIAGIVMHLYIAFVTGLPGFAAVMLLGYVFFWPMKPANPEN